MAHITYSPVFSVLHDESGPIGSIGAGAHSSVLAAVQWRNAAGQLLVLPQIQKFGVIWDEDHDTRIIPVLEAAYMNDLLAPVLFIGERKASLTVIVDNAFPLAHSPDFEESWSVVLDDSLENDQWDLQIVLMSEADEDPARYGQIIKDSADRVRIYLANLRNLWRLGIQPHPSQVKKLKK